MRFHFGVSFRFKTLKKFLFPILIGVLTYFGINFLGLGIINVNALENYDTSFNIQYRDLDYLLDSKIDDNITYRQFLENLSNLQSNYYKLIIGTSFNISAQGIYSFPAIRIYLVPIEVSSLSSSLFGNSSGFNIRIEGYSRSTPLFNQYLNSTNIGTDIYNSSMYLGFLDCFQNNNCTNNSYIDPTGGSLLNNFPIGIGTTSINNDNSNDIYFPKSENTNSLALRFIYYSQVPIYISNDYNLTNSTTFYKKIMFYDNELTIGDYFPTYKDYVDNLPSDDDNDDDTTNHKLLFNKIYWFDDNTTELGVLSSIYILLFLYCITMIFFKIATLLKNKRW